MLHPQRQVRAEEGAKIRLEKSRDAVEQRPPIGPGVEESGPRPHQRWRAWALHLAPKRVELGKPICRSVAGNQAGIDGPNRGPDKPVRLDAGFVERLIDADLISAQSAAALQDQGYLAIRPLAKFIDRVLDGSLWHVRSPHSLEHRVARPRTLACAPGSASKSMGGPAAIDGQCSPGDRCCCIAGKKHRQRAKLIDAGKTLVGLLRQENIANDLLTGD